MDFKTCHICLLELVANPLYKETVSKYCPDDGDFFVQHLRGQEPVVIFRPFPEESTDKSISNADGTPRKSRWLFHGRTGSRAGNPGYIVKCDQTGQVFSSIREAAATMQMARSKLSEHISGKRSAVKGYTFTKIADNIGELPK